MTLEFVGLLGMLTQMTISHFVAESQTWPFCFCRILWRFFGLSSGCVAFLMAVERYFALTKPFWYCKHFTNGLMYRLIIVLWLIAGILTFMPVFGFGIYFNEEKTKCERYRDATKTGDKAYAFIFFFVGNLIKFYLPCAGNQYFVYIFQNRVKNIFGFTKIYFQPHARTWNFS
jgi:hypothetical protein